MGSGVSNDSYDWCITNTMLNHSLLAVEEMTSFVCWLANLKIKRNLKQKMLTPVSPSLVKFRSICQAPSGKRALILKYKRTQSGTVIDCIKVLKISSDRITFTASFTPFSLATRSAISLRRSRASQSSSQRRWPKTEATLSRCFSATSFNSLKICLALAFILLLCAPNSNLFLEIWRTFRVIWRKPRPRRMSSA